MEMFFVFFHSGSIDGNNQLVIKGRFQQKQIENVLRRYISKFINLNTYFWNVLIGLKYFGGSHWSVMKLERLALKDERKWWWGAGGGGGSWWLIRISQLIKVTGWFKAEGQVRERCLHSDLAWPSFVIFL